MVGIVNTVCIVHENKHLMERDLSDFKVFWDMLDVKESVTYQVGLDFIAEVNSLIVLMKQMHSSFVILLSLTP
jgi:hypothetical protein